MSTFLDYLSGFLCIVGGIAVAYLIAAVVILIAWRRH